jgi:uncharacterized protein
MVSRRLGFVLRLPQAIATLQTNPLVEVVRLTSDIFAEAIELYSKKNDKDWGLTDCVSFIVMRERGLTESLTVDKHFLEAGFRALLRES